MILLKKFPLTELQVPLAGTEKLLGICPESDILNPNFPTHSIKMDFFLQISMRQQLVK